MWWTFGVSLLVVLAGCLGSQTPAPEPQPSALGEGILPEPIATGLANSSEPLGDWWYVEVEAGATGSAIGFHWTIPEGAFVDDAFFDDWETLVLEVLVVPHQEAEVSGYVLGVFEEGGKGWTPSWLELEVPVTGRSLLTPALATPFELGPSFEPRLVTFTRPKDYDGLSEGDRLGLVLAAFGSGRLGLAFHVLPKDPGFEYAAPSSDEYLAQVASTGRPQVPAVEGRASAAHAEAYVDINIGIALPVGVFGIEYKTAGLTVTDAWGTQAARPAVSIRQAQFGTEFKDVRSGWSYQSMVYWGDLGIGKFDVATRGFVPPPQGSYLTAGAYGTALINGYVAYGDGEGTVRTAIDGTWANANGIELLQIVEVAFAATLGDLLGGDGDSASGAYSLVPPLYDAWGLTGRQGETMVRLVVPPPPNP
jgi:hypothetical protein